MGSADWSINALKEYMDRRFETMTNAVDTATQALDLRLEAMNKFRAQIQTERAEYLSKVDYDQRHQTLETLMRTGDEKIEVRLAALERWQSKLLGAMGLVLILMPLLIGVLIFYITRQRYP